MNYWSNLGLESKIRDILKGIVYKPDPSHHFGHPFITAYQLAMIFADKYPNDVAAIGLPLGGSGAGVPNSLAQYFANQLSQRIKNGSITDIEGGFLDCMYMGTVTFYNNRNHLSTDLNYISIFKLKSEEFKE